MIRIPKWIQRLFSQLQWSVNTKDKVLYLTFDDGPHPTITKWILDTLKQYNAKATFFCIGENAQLQPDLINRIQKENHSIGNHTNKHLRGWNTTNKKYFLDVDKCHEIIPSTIFRPPYGQISLSQIRQLKKKFKIVMWDVNAWDFKKHNNMNTCFNNVIKNATKGSIILMHDNIKSGQNVKACLPAVLEYYQAKGFRFEAL
jgi:peptidoglycan/xylan/chitin deacetylase (PgdA/CDA1 family)